MNDLPVLIACRHRHASPEAKQPGGARGPLPLPKLALPTQADLFNSLFEALFEALFEDF